MLVGQNYYFDKDSQRSRYNVDFGDSLVRHLYCSNLTIDSKDLSRHTCLKDLILNRCSVKNLDLSSLMSLESFEYCLEDSCFRLQDFEYSNGDRWGGSCLSLKSLNISSNPNLTSLTLVGSCIRSLDIKGLTLLRRLQLGLNESLTEIVCDESNVVEELNIHSAHSDLIGSDELTFFKGLVKLSVCNSNAKALDLKSLTRLESLDCSHNNLTHLDLSHLSLLKSLNCQNTDK